jgi:hypothetical protein
MYRNMCSFDTAVYFNGFIWVFAIGYTIRSLQTIIKLHAGISDIFCYDLEHKILKIVQLRQDNALKEYNYNIKREDREYYKNRDEKYM